MKKRVLFIVLFSLISGISCLFAQEQPPAGGEKAKSISYKEFLPFLPQKIANLVPKDKPDGKTTKMGTMSLTEVSQVYIDPANEKNTGSFRISYNSMLASAGGFGMMFPDVEEESTNGYKKTVAVGDYKVMVEYENASNYARVSVSAGAIMVEADAAGVENEAALLEIIKAMDLNALKKIGE